MRVLFLAAVCGAVAAAAGAPTPPGTLVWADEFTALNLSKWKHEITLGGGGNWEFEYYSNNRSTSFTNDSILHIQPLLTADQIGAANVESGYTMDLWGSTPADTCTSNAFYGCSRTSGGGNIINPVASARLRTAESFSFKYGHVQIRAKMPRGDWLWPAMWFLPRDNAYGEWPASGEIDLCESRGNADYASGGVNQFGSTLHWGPFYGQDPFAKTHATYTVPTGDLSADFHVYGLIWTEDSIITYFDDPSQVVLNVSTSSMSFWERGGWNGSTLHNPWTGAGTNAPFDQEFFIVLNVAVGGTSGYFPDGVGGKPWSDTSKTAAQDFWNAKGQWYPSWQAAQADGANDLQVDYVRVYQQES